MGKWIERIIYLYVSAYRKLQVEEEKKMSMHYFQLDNNSVLCNNLRPNLIPYVTFRRKKNYLRNSQRDQTVTDLSFIFKLKKIINCPLNTQLY